MVLNREKVQKYFVYNCPKIFSLVFTSLKKTWENCTNCKKRLKIENYPQNCLWLLCYLWSFAIYFTEKTLHHSTFSKDFLKNWNFRDVRFFNLFVANFALEIVMSIKNSFNASKICKKENGDNCDKSWRIITIM